MNENCIFYIEIFGAHRGGVYCQRFKDHAEPLYNCPYNCDYYCYDNNKPHNILFDLTKYPNLLSKEEKDKLL